MAKKKMIVGFKGVALAPITENSVTSYKTEAAEGVPYAGQMTRTDKETSQDFFYDDELYAQVKDTSGADVELRFAEIPLDKMAELGLGELDETTGVLNADFNIPDKEYSLRCVCDTVSSVPRYINYRLFVLNGIKFDNFQTKGDSITACEVIMTGIIKRPALASAKPIAYRDAKDDMSDLAACDSWLKAAETLPASVA